MPVKDQAAYMREYRARKRTEAENALEAAISAEAQDITATSELKAENARLTEEVARLKLELAARPVAMTTEERAAAISRLIGPTNVDSFAQFRPAPKIGRK